MKSNKNFAKSFLTIVGCLIFCGLSTFAISAQEAVDLPAFTTANTLTLERYDGSRGTTTTQIFRDLSDKDHIWISRTPNAVSRDKVRILMVPGGRVSWWKGITVYKKISTGRDAGKWRRLQHVSVENTNGASRPITLDINQLDGVALSFEKAKALGAHTPMYVFHLDAGRSDLAGQQVLFRWERDN